MMRIGLVCFVLFFGIFQCCQDAHAHSIKTAMDHASASTQSTVQKFRAWLKRTTEQVNTYKFTSAVGDKAGMTTIVLSSLGSLLSGNMLMDLSQCLPKINANFNFQFGLPSIWGRTALGCSPNGALKFQQDYFMSYGSVGGQTLGGQAGGYGKTLIGDSSSGNVQSGVRSVQEKRTKDVSLQAALTDFDAQKMMKDLTAGSVDASNLAVFKKNQDATTWIENLSGLFLAHADAVNTVIAGAPALTNDTELMSFEATQNMSAYLDEHIHPVDARQFYAGLFKANPQYFVDHPEDIAMAPEMLIGDPAFIDQHPRVKIALQKLILDHPEERQNFAKAWVQFPQMHPIYAEIVPVESKTNKVKTAEKNRVIQ